MIELLRQMFAEPDSPAEAYAWAAALLGHWAIGAGLTVLALAVARPATAAAAVSLAYGLLWEGGQLLLAGAHGRRPASVEVQHPRCPRSAPGLRRAGA